MKTPVKVVLIVGMTLLPVAAVFVYGVTRPAKDPGGSGEPGSYAEVDWRVLRGLDIQTGAKTKELESLDGKFVKVPGFVVPLDDDAATFSEFLLVPSPQACVHVPPPPPNQMIFVRMKSGKAPQRSWGPVWVMGRLIVATTESQFGKVSYMLHGDSSEVYSMPDEAPPPP